MSWAEDIGYEGVSGIVTEPILVSTETIPQATEADLLETYESVERPYDPEVQKIKQRKYVPPVGEAIRPDYEIDTSVGTPQPEAAYLTTNFEAINYTGWIPPDPILAVGPNHIVVMVNKSWAIYDKEGNQGYIVTLPDWWAAASPPGGPFDPKCCYDQLSGRWILLAAAKGTTTSAYMLAVSDDDNPYGSWWLWRLDATVNGSTSTNNWADYPQLGYDSEALYITSNQYEFGGGFQYAKLRVLNKATAYAGGGLSWWDAWNFKNADGSNVRTWQPCHTFGYPGKEWLVNTESSSSGDAVTLWTLDNPTTSPVLTREATIGIGSYEAPPDAEQLGGTYRINTMDSRIINAVYRSGYVYASFAEKYNWGSGDNCNLRYLKLNVTTSSAYWNKSYGASGYYYYYPSIYPDVSGNIAVCFARSGASEYVGARHTGRRTIDSAMQSSSNLKAGEGYYQRVDSYGRNRWGDYTGIGIDPTDNKTFWIYNEYADTGNVWNTWIGAINFTYPALMITYPNGGEALERGKYHTITWAKAGFPGTKVKIDLYKSGIYYSTITSSTDNDGSLSWYISSGQYPNSYYKIRISSVANPTVYDYSDNYFEIFRRYISVTSPNGGENWETGQNYNITWAYDNAGSTVKIQLYKGGSLYSTITSSTPNDGSYSWTIASYTPASDYKVKVTSNSYSSYVYDYSNANFSLFRRRITVTSPTYGAEWKRGQAHNITWTEENAGSTVKIELYKGGGLDSTIAASTANDGSHYWTIPSTKSPGSDYQIKITSNAYTYVYGSNTFLIVPESTVMIDFGPPHGLYIYDDPTVPKPEATTQIVASGAEHVLAVDIDGDGVEELLLESGQYVTGSLAVYDNGVVTPIVAVGPEKMIKTEQDYDAEDEVLIDFGLVYGLYLYNSGGLSSLGIIAEDFIAADIDGGGLDEFIIDQGCGYGAIIWDVGGTSPFTTESPTFMTKGDIDGDASEEVVYALSSGLYVYNNGIHSILNPVPPEYVVCADVDNDGMDELLVAFNQIYGLYLYNGGVWTQLSTTWPNLLVKAQLDTDSGDELAYSIAGEGLYLYNAGIIKKVHPLSCESILPVDTNNDGIDELFIDFGPKYGLYRYDLGTFTLINSMSPEYTVEVDGNGDSTDQMDCSDNQDEAAIDFGAGKGIWLYDYDNGNNNLKQIHTVTAESILAADIDADNDIDGGDGIGDELIIDWGTAYGLYKYDSGVYTQLNTVSPELMDKFDLYGFGTEQLVVDYGPGYGLYLIFEGYWHSKIHTLSPLSITIADILGDCKEDIVANFGPAYGLWLWDYGTWSQINTLAPERVWKANLDGDSMDELIINYGSAHGTWIFNHISGHCKLNNVGAEDVAAADVDADGRDELLIDYGSGYGLYLYDYTGGPICSGAHTNLNLVSPEGLLPGNFDKDAREEVIVDFGSSYGTYIYNLGSMTKINNLSQLRMKAADFDGDMIDEVIFDFGGVYGTWFYDYVGGVWKKISKSGSISITPADNL